MYTWIRFKISREGKGWEGAVLCQATAPRAARCEGLLWALEIQKQGLSLGHRQVALENSFSRLAEPSLAG